jgi:hypothetical protein
LVKKWLVVVGGKGYDWKAVKEIKKGRRSLVNTWWCGKRTRGHDRKIAKEVVQKRTAFIGDEM